ncbi:MAG: hypothetical protein IH613_13985 [Desulfuromonadales bacterium]|nr:hypothetical protein [Desulfuromonadales bacterium]
MRNFRMKQIYLWFVCLMALGSGCVEPSRMYYGNSVSPDKVISIQNGGSHKGYVETFDVVINYEFVRDGEVLDIVGQAALSERNQLLFASLRKLFVYLFFLDENSRVLETVSLTGALTGDTYERLGFSRTLKVPAGSVGISFGYSGEANESNGDGNGGTYTFYRLPLR